jgi:hypothetical protein
VYFTVSPAPSSPDGQVLRVAKDGSTNIKLAMTEKDPSSICVDDTYVYWFSGDFDHHVIKRAFKKGGGLVEVVYDTMTAVFALTVETQALYWTGPIDDTVWMKPKSGGAAVPLATGQTNPSGVAADASGVYWLNEGSAAASDGAVMRADLSGMNVQTLVSAQKFPLRIALDAGHVYWATLDGGLVGAGKDGKNLFPYVTSGTPITGLAADGAHIYYTTNNKVFKVPVGSLSVEQIPLEGEYPGNVAVDETSLYVAVAQTAEPDMLVKLPK